MVHVCRIFPSVLCFKTFADAKLIKKKGMASVSRTIHRLGYKCALTLWVDKKWTVVNLDMPDYFSTCQKGPMMESRQDEIFFGDFAVSNKIIEHEVHAHI